jgi:hypothetical protein
MSGEKTCVLLPARALACGGPDFSHVKREAGANGAGKRWWPRCLCLLSCFAERRKMERRKTQGTPPHLAVRRRPLWGRLAFRRSTTALPKGCVVPWCDPGQASWGLCQRGGYDRRLCPHIQRRTPHAGHSAGRHDARTARERVASPPAGTASRPDLAACLRKAVLHWARRFVYACN